MARTALIVLVVMLSLWGTQHKPLVASPTKHVQTGWLQLISLASQGQGQVREYSLPVPNQQGMKLYAYLGDVVAPTQYQLEPKGVKGCRVEIKRQGLVSVEVEKGSVSWQIKMRFVAVYPKLASFIYPACTIQYELLSGINQYGLTSYLKAAKPGLETRIVGLIQAWRSTAESEDISLRTGIFNQTLSIKNRNVHTITLTLLIIDEQGLLPHKIILSPSVSLSSDPYSIQFIRFNSSSLDARLTTIDFVKYKCPMGSLYMYGSNDCVTTCQKRVGDGRYQVCFESQSNLKVGANAPRYLSGYYNYGYGASCSNSGCPGGWTTASTCQKCGNSYKITSCVSGYYLRNEQCKSCTLSQCTSCYWSNWKNKQMCTACNAGFYPKSGTCQTCADTCLTCSYYSFLWWSGIKCSTCVGNLVVLDKMCECYSNQYMVSSPSYNCVNCPSGCKYCNWDGSVATCTACQNGYYLSGGACPACMRPCATCSSGTTCDTPVGNLVMNGNVAECASGDFFDNSTLRCEPCTHFHSDCATCDYNPSGYDPANIAPVQCTVADPKFFVANGTTHACGSYCDVCTSATYCTTPSATFTVDPVSGVSFCDDTLPTPLYVTNSAPYQCQPCGTVIPGCTNCQNNTATECMACGGAYYAATAVPVSTCTACGILCSTCSDGSTCSGCINNLVLNMGTFVCECPALTFLHSLTNNCEPCQNLVLHCNTCSYSAPNILCSACDNNYYVAGDSLSCIQCSDPNCQTCDASGCLTCEPGYTTSGSTCICDAADCGLCQSNIGPQCAACTAGFAPCTDCSVGYYDNGGTCTVCPVTCDECSYNATSTQVECDTCNSPFLFNSNYECVCDNAALLYITTNGSTCDTCANIIPNCTACDDSSGATLCTAAISGHFVQPSTNTSVSPCNETCTQCVGAANNCTACLNTYTMVSAGNCECDNANGEFYNPTSLGCSPCAQLVADCSTCVVNGGNASLTDCSVCVAPKYVNVTDGQCVMCPTQCSSCTIATLCTGCANNLVLTQDISLTPNGLCVCDNSSTTDIYYNSANNRCQACANILSSCTTCSDPGNGTILCTACDNGTYLENATCHICNSQCETCDSNGCLSCPSGTTLSGTTCDCGTACLACSGASPNCLACTMSGSSVSACSSCSPGYYVMGSSCVGCPVSCATCTSNSNCGICKATYQLSAGRCVCDQSQNLYENSGKCSVCTDIVTSCAQCDYNGISTSCLTCTTGYYVSGSSCLPCNATCGSCDVDPNNCTSCSSGYTLSGSNCNCGAACTTCAGHQANCIECNYDIYLSFASCRTCADTFFLNSSTGVCDACPSDCHDCGSGGLCTVCPVTYELISGRCQCNTAVGMFENNNTMQCQLCASMHTDCSICEYNSSSSTNVACQTCISGYYLSNDTCVQSVCGDGIVTPLEQCDDANNQGGDGCDSCFVEVNYACTGEPSTCVVSVHYEITSRSMSVDPLACNKISFAFDIDPYYQSYDDADFTAYLTGTNSSAIERSGWRYRKGKGVIIYEYEILRNLDKRPIAFYFSPSLLGVNETKDIPLITVEYAIHSTNNIKPYRLSEDKCSKKAAVKTFTESMEYGSYGVMAASALPCKIVGLEMFGVLQLAHLSVGSMDNVNPLLTPMMAMKGVHGYQAQLDDEDDNPSSDTGNRRRLSTTPNRVSSIGYSSNFLRNCNVMIWVTVGLMAVSFLFVALSCFCETCCPCLYAFSRRIMKELLLTLILFNCFNFAYSAGIHFQYNSTQDHLYFWGTVAAIASLVLPLLMAIGLACAEEVGFGEFKEKMKMGAVERAYFVVTILYRTGLGIYMSMENVSELSTLVVLGISILFLLYNLVNLPFTKAFHNYRANICHLSQFVCLFIALYYRSMKSTTSSSEVADEEYPAYIFLASILLSFVVSFICLIYEVVLFIIDCCKEKEELPSEESKSNLTLEKDEKQFVTEQQLDEHHSNISELHPSQLGNIDFEAYQ